MRKRESKWLFRLLGWSVCLLLGAAWLGTASASAATPEAYNWRNVSIGGGGYVTGMAIHPTEPDLVYIRTDVGGAYRWDPDNDEWIQLLNGLTEQESNMYGIDSIALDPSDPDVVYLAAGKYDYSPSDILKSTDRGATWTRTGFTPRHLGNGGLRDTGERLAVDPNDGSVIFMGTRYNGLWTSTSAASYGSWQQVGTFPVNGTSPYGLMFVVFDKSTGTPGNPTQTIYVGVKGGGIYRSTDGGATWSLLSGSPADANRAAVAGDGALYVSHNLGVAKFDNGVWSDATPPTAAKYNGITVHPTDPSIVMAAVQGFEDPIYRSTDGGETWTEMAYVKHPDVPWWTGNWWAASTSSLTIDPTEPDRVWYTDFFGTWRTDDIEASPSHWYTSEHGHEEVVTFALRSTPVGAPLLSGHADVDGMRHTSLDAYPSARFVVPYLGDTNSIDFQESNPNYVVRVGATRYNYTGGGGYSTDNGATWTAFANPPGIAGRVAVSASTERIVWVPQSGMPYYSTDRGQSWTPASGAPANTIHDFWVWYQPLASDRVDPDTFYLLDRTSGNFHRSVDGGATWSVASNLAGTGTPFFSVKAAPGMEGEVWTSLDSGGLMRSSDSGSTWTKLPNVQRAKLFAFGKNRLGYDNPTVFVYGTVDNAAGIFRSDDFGDTWMKIDMPGLAIGNEPNTMEGDRQVWGRVYIGTNGTGVYYGESLTSEGVDEEAPSAPTNLSSPSQTSTTIQLAWTASTDNTGVTGYDIYRGGVFAGTTLNPSSTTFTVAGLTPDTTYSFTVKAKDAAGNFSAASAALSATTAPPPASPTNLVSTSSTRTSIALSWDPPGNPAGVSGYNIYSGSRLVGTTPSTAFTVSGLLPGDYTFTVRSKDSAGSTSAPSSPLAASTLPGPGTLGFSDNFEDGAADGWTSLHGTWSVVTAGGSRVYRQSSWTDTMTYSTTGDTAWDNYSVETRMKLTSADVDLGAGLIARFQDPNNYYTFRIRAGVLQITKYADGVYSVIVEKNYSLATNVPYTFTAVLNNGALELYVDGIKELSAQDTSLATGKIGVLAYKVSAEFDLVKVLHDQDFTPPSTPSNLTSPSTSETAIELSWNASSDNIGTTEYEIYNGGVLAGTTSGTTFTVDGLDPGTTYSLTVKAKDAAGNVSGASNPLAVTTGVYLVQPKRTLAEIAIDGTLDEAAWTMTASPNKAIIGSPIHAAEFGALWDEDYLYVGVKVIDGQLVNDSVNVYADDSVEIYIDGNHNAGAAYDGFDRQYIKGWNDSALFEKSGLAGGALHAWGTIDGGYAVELAIPWSELGIEPEAGMIVGFDVAVNNDDDGDDRESQSMWAGTGDNWTNTSAFGDLKLSAATIGDTEAPSAPTNLTVAVHTDRTVDLTWTASTDNVGVAEYEIYNGSALIGTTSSTSYTVAGLTPEATYAFTVKAKDGEHNVSAPSAPVSVTMDESYTRIDVAKTAVPVTVDGHLTEAEWTMVKQLGKVVSGTPNNTAEFGVLWDDDYLYVGISVTDGDLYNNSAEPYADDSVEIYIDGDHNKGTAYDSYDRQLIKGWNDSALFESRNLGAGVLHAWGTTTGGYSVELAIPWSSLGLTPSANMIIGFDVANNDEDNGSGRDSQTVWAGTADNWTNTAEFGELRLSLSMA